jgi:hypothetical protein
LLSQVAGIKEGTGRTVAGIKEGTGRMAARALGPCLVPSIILQILLYKKKIPHHIKMSANAWSTKC